MFTAYSIDTVYYFTLYIYNTYIQLFAIVCKAVCRRPSESGFHRIETNRNHISHENYLQILNFVTNLFYHESVLLIVFSSHRKSLLK